MSRIMTSFNAHSTAFEVVEGVDLSGKTAIVTGGASGIGIETARALSFAGADVVLAVRNVTAAATVVDGMRIENLDRSIRAMPLDLADLQSVKRFCEQWHGALDILVNNAGIMALPAIERTQQGWELQFATNFLGHFALTLGLRRALAVRGGRVVSLSSSGHLLSPMIFDDLHFNFVRYDPYLAYGQSKTATALLAVALTDQWRADGIVCNAVMPGAIATNLQRHTGGLQTPEARRKTPSQGAATTVLVATAPQLASVGGRYFEDCNEALPVNRRNADYTGVAPYALDPQNAERLWQISLNLLAEA